MILTNTKIEGGIEHIKCAFENLTYVMILFWYAALLLHMLHCKIAGAGHAAIHRQGWSKRSSIEEPRTMLWTTIAVLRGRDCMKLTLLLQPRILQPPYWWVRTHMQRVNLVCYEPLLLRYVVVTETPSYPISCWGWGVGTQRECDKQATIPYTLWTTTLHYVVVTETPPSTSNLVCYESILLCLMKVTETPSYPISCWCWGVGTQRAPHYAMNHYVVVTETPPHFTPYPAEAGGWRLNTLTTNIKRELDREPPLLCYVLRRPMYYRALRFVVVTKPPPPPTPISCWYNILVGGNVIHCTLTYSQWNLY